MARKPATKWKLRKLPTPVAVALIMALGGILTATIPPLIPMIFGTPTLTPSRTPSPTPTLTPSQTSSPTLTPIPSQTPSLTPTLTPSPSPTCPADVPEKRADHNGKHARIAEVHYMINKGPVVQIAFGETIPLNHGDVLELTQIKYVASKDFPATDNLGLETYHQYSGCLGYYSDDGRFSTSTSIKGGGIPFTIPDPILDINKFVNPGWTVGRGWQQILIVLIHNYAGCGEKGCVAIEDRFRISVIVQ
jgi:hypothetical protein